MPALTFLGNLILCLYAASSLGLFLYSINCYVMIALYLRRGQPTERPWAPRVDWPTVTTQIPLFNEANVAERVLRAAAAIEYLAELHEIQVLDDSTDETRDIVDRVARELRAAGHRIVVLRRAQRTGFKAGALAAGLPRAAGEFLAIFDGDFVPPRNFLRATIPFFFADERMGLVQARWGHLNAGESFLTRGQAIGIDGHFAVEQAARAFNGLLMNFNGTAGIWRRRAIEDAGGWSADTLTEDLDLSYRAQLAGWRTHFVSNLVAPAELPSSIAAFKSQQFRWAKGSIQTARKLLPKIWRAPLSPWVKLQATLHLTHYAVHPLMLIVAVCALPAIVLTPVLPAGIRPGLAAILLLSMMGPNALYGVGQRALYKNWRRRLCSLPAVMCMGVGLALSNSRAVAEGLLGSARGEFVRTPKRGDKRGTDYRIKAPLMPWLEISFGVYCLIGLSFYLRAGRFLIGPFLLLYAISFFVVGFYGVWEARHPRAPKVDFASIKITLKGTT